MTKIITNSLSRRNFIKYSTYASLSTLVPPFWGGRVLAGSSAVINDLGNGRVEVSDWWAEQCELLPCFKGIEWPGYDERILKHHKINGQEVVIHLWKGYCQKFLKSDQWPGGSGAEVGVYKVRSDKWMRDREKKAHQNMDSLWSVAPEGALTKVKKHLNGNDGKGNWYPAPELKTRIKFRLFNPHDGKIVFGTREKDTWWNTEWMKDHAYHEWEDKNEKMHPEKLTLEYWINGEKYDLWEHPDAIKGNHLTFRKVCLKAHDQKHYVSPTMAGGMTANKPKCDTWEHFHAVWLSHHEHRPYRSFEFGKTKSGDKIGLVNAHFKNYVTAQSSGRLGSDAKYLDSWEEFVITKVNGHGPIHSGDWVTLESTAHKKYLTSEGGGGGVMNANRDKADAWEHFRIYEA